MSFTHALSTNRYGEGDLIVSTSAANGTHVTLASAMSAAVSGQTIFLRDSVTENITLTPGVNISAWAGGSLNTPTIIGTITMTGAGTSTISGIRLQTNSATFLTVSGSAASIVNLNNCFLNCTNNTGISYTSSSASSAIACYHCTGDLGTTGIALFVSTSTGSMYFKSCSISNGGLSLTNSSSSAGTLALRDTDFAFALTTTANCVYSANNSSFNTFGLNITTLTHGGLAASNIQNCTFASGTASAVSIGGSLPMSNCVFNTSNANAIVGAGTLDYAGLAFIGTTDNISTTTQVGHVFRPGIVRSLDQPAFLVYVNSSILNVTGDGTVYTIVWDLEVYDQNGDMTTTTFTAPYTGRYQFDYKVSITGGTTITVITPVLTTSNNPYLGSSSLNAASTVNASGTVIVLADMDLGDTATFSIATTDTGKTDDVSGVATNVRTWASGYLVC